MRRSQTGSGKTLAFLLPLEELILRDEETNQKTNLVKAIILEPTRELAIQVKSQIDRFSSLRSEVIYGGDTPGRVQSKY
jgi:superfamily II DNA/RNA helicase